MTKFFVVACIALLASACSQTPTVSGDETIDSFLAQEELTPALPTERIVNFTIDSWKYIDPYNIMIKTKRKENYLVSLGTNCQRLENNIAIGTTSTGGALTKFDKIIYDDHALGPQDCLIRNIVKLEPIKDSSE